ncbi:hypothetical protein FRC17_007454 [Serendipita sp. 399]|nr:hypothetical protein FRC17_007454 [Serendipita sp. 399]
MFRALESDYFRPTQVFVKRMSSETSSDDELEMQSALSEIPPASVPHSHHEPVPPKEEPMEADTTPIKDEPTASAPSLDLMNRISGMFRLLDLVTERGSGGLVDKILIAQESVSLFANLVHPGSYRSTTQVDFRSLDKHAIKPRGLYGSMESIANFLLELGCIDEETRSLLLRPRDEHSGISRPTLRPGLYIVSSAKLEESLAYVVFWPEDATWQDGAISSVSRNRVTFMRYLTKLCEQIVCLVSDEHSEALVWKDEAPVETEDEEAEAFDDRMFGFSVEQTNAEEENAIPSPGFSIRSLAIDAASISPSGYPDGYPLEMLTSRMVVGETAQAILQVQFIPEEQTRTVIKENMFSLALKARLSKQRTPVVILKEGISQESFKNALENGLWDRCGDLQFEFKDKLSKMKRAREAARVEERKTWKKTASHDRVALEKWMIFWIGKQAVSQYLIFPEPVLFEAILPPGTEFSSKECDTAIASMESWFEDHPLLRKQVSEEVQANLQKLDNDPDARYNKLKERLRYVLAIFEENPSLSPMTAQRVFELLSIQKNFKKELTKVLEQEQAAPATVLGTVWSYVATKKQVELPNLPPLDDISFASSLVPLAEGNIAYTDIVKELITQIRDSLRRKVRSLANTIPAKIEQALVKHCDNLLDDKYNRIEKEEESMAWADLLVEVNIRLSRNPSTRHEGDTLIIDSISAIRRTNTHYWTGDQFQVKGTLLIPNKAGFQYRLHPLDIKQDDVQGVAQNPHHICSPVVRERCPPPIFLPLNTLWRIIHPLDKDRCFAITSNGVHMNVYMENIDHLASAVDTGKAIKQLHHEKLGNNPLFAIDETQRLFAILSITEASILLHVYIYDLDARTFIARGGAFNMTRWFSFIPEITHLVFATGTENILLIQKDGLCRIFSLISETDRPSTIKLQGEARAAFSSADGACLMVQVVKNGEASLMCYHWPSFGTTGGIEIPWPADVPLDASVTVSSIGHRGGTYILFTVPRLGLCTSVYVRITKKSSDFTFRPSGNITGSSGDTKKTANNSLIDCHSEVWTRFPVKSPIAREMNAEAVHQPRSVLFISCAPSANFAPYFNSMVRDFEYRTRKPTKGALKAIQVNAKQKWDPLTAGLDVSEMRVGDWLMGLFCLIPIHLAITRSNRFIPLKDGVTSPAFENTLLGASVAQISEAITFGWYESIFSSYLANKPVKIVTSMGDLPCVARKGQVWLSVTPTREYLAVAVDFEGVHSIERSAQEDTLLVLLNAAISNFVLFRNNFALSRDIAGLFKSFQLCTKVLDPAANPSLFHSTLGIIIKDVIDSDTKEIVREFHQKFQTIVQQERADNFISKLHRGKLDIIPWPVIESARFYDLFTGLKQRLDRQPVTHQHAGAFLSTLKMLMAKLKANDWGALDQNLALQRTQMLETSLPCALAFGTCDPSIGEALRNYDTDEILEGGSPGCRFYLDGLRIPGLDDSSVEKCLLSLRATWKDRVKRFSMGEETFIEGFNAHLRNLAEDRIKVVNAWLTANTTRFGEKAEVTSLFRVFDKLAKELRQSVILCGSKCTSCGLLCLDHKQHEGDHNCMTSHKCPDICSFTPQHTDSELPACGLPAGHTGRHVCSEMPHLCGLPCRLSGKEGCLHACVKSMGHDDDEEHMCSGRVHECGELCDLVKPDGTRICSRPCVIAFESMSVTHVIVHYPARFNASFATATVPPAITSTHWIPRPNTFVVKPISVVNSVINPGYARSIQSRTRSSQPLLVGIRLSNTPSIRKRNVASLVLFLSNLTTYDMREGTYTLRILRQSATFQITTDYEFTSGHPQPEHSTSHGSMTHTEWVVEGDEDTTFQMKGHRYAAGDSGAPMLCSLLCTDQGRHVHVDKCNPDEYGRCYGKELEHMDALGAKQDWISHRLFWGRSGFVDPYTVKEQEDFALCDHRCGGEEHDPEKNKGAVASYCTLPIFHLPEDPKAQPETGYISKDGHRYDCKNPAQMQRAFHIYFVIDISGSMIWQTDCQPREYSPASSKIRPRFNNRLGALLEALYGFWLARDTATRKGASSGARSDAYTLVRFAEFAKASVTFTNDTSSTPDELLDMTLNQPHDCQPGLNDFNEAMRVTGAEMERTWSSERSPVIIFLSDGEDPVPTEAMYDVCRSAVRRGRPVAFYSLLFGQDVNAQSLIKMAEIAKEVWDTAPPDPLNPSAYAQRGPKVVLTFSSDAAAVHVSSTAAFLYPGYKSYKALSKRNVDEAELERWLMYWSVIGFISAFEYVAEWLISWIPLYYFFKTVFLLFLALPQTQGSTFIYSVHLAPLLRGHEDQIDSALSQMKLAVYEFIQEKLRSIWNQVSGGSAAQAGIASSGPVPSTPNVGAVNPPSMADPLSGAVQLVSGWWNSYAPAVIATGAAYIASRQQAAEQAVQQRRLQREQRTQPQKASDTASVLARRRELEAELAALPLVASPSPSTTLKDPLTGNSSTSVASSSSSYGIHSGETRRRKVESGSEGEGGKYENIAPEDVGSAGEDSPTRASNPRTSWWGWRASSYQGYERVKND